MESLANQLRMEMLNFNKYGSLEDRNKAKAVFQKVTDLAIDVASKEGGSYINFDEDTLPRESIEYFKVLCENEELKFEMCTSRTPGVKTKYTVSWG